MKLNSKIVKCAYCDNEIIHTLSNDVIFEMPSNECCGCEPYLILTDLQTSIFNEIVRFCKFCKIDDVSNLTSNEISDIAGKCNAKIKVVRLVLDNVDI
uniref:Uncharacterized protein n=1 Tax=Aliivibrio wodanis TaxID=80852 RepID=A0A5Q4ZY86_9GAMM|nr:hypothetical protein [Aliivibrio wodanis]VVV06829.1 hypothetical protein AW0309160_04323 [Aliivibrio wodanis]